MNRLCNRLIKPLNKLMIFGRTKYKKKNSLLILFMNIEFLIYSFICFIGTILLLLISQNMPKTNKDPYLSKMSIILSAGLIFVMGLYLLVQSFR
jgi:hypothetical protein